MLKTKTAAGFTLTELVVAVAIIAVLSAISLAVFQEAQKNARDARRKQDLRNLQVALEVYYNKNNRYPCSTVDLQDIDAGNWQKSSSLNEPWIDDQCEQKIPFDSKYLSQQPQDPKNTPNNSFPWDNDNTFVYAYWAAGEDLSLSFEDCPKGKSQFYILAARLERNDPETSKPEKVNFCDREPIIGYHGDSEISIPLMHGDNPQFEGLLILTSQDAD